MGKKMLTILNNIFNESISLWLAIAPYLILGLFIAGVLHVFLGRDFISRHLGGSTLGSIVKATVLGIPLPICSCGVIPVAASLKKEGASTSATLSFLVSTPTTGVDSIFATYSLMGPLFTVFRPLAAFISGVSIGLFNHLWNKETSQSAPSHQTHSISTKFKLKAVFRYGFVELVQDIGKWLLIGVVIGGILTAVIPQEFLLNYFSNPLLQILVMLVLAIPLYVCATGSIPIATALIQKGISPGAALVFLIAGPATNTVTLSFVRSKLGKRAFYLYLSAIILVSILMGLLFNLLWKGLGGNVSLISPHGGMMASWIQISAGILLFLVIAKGMLKRKKDVYKEMAYQWKVEDMHCKNCQMTLESKLKDLAGVTDVVVNLEDKRVGVNGQVKPGSVEKTIREAGYTPESEKEDS
jgi:uncharacterized membrane protein YraQ (UPF0718 family)/copper chaperone CopZ